MKFDFNKMAKSVKRAIFEIGLDMADNFNGKNISLTREEIFKLTDDTTCDRYLNACHYASSHMSNILKEISKFNHSISGDNYASERFGNPLAEMKDLVHAAGARERLPDFQVEVPEKTFKKILRNLDVLHEALLSHFEAQAGRPAINLETAESLILLHNGLTAIAQRKGIGAYADPQYRDATDIYLEDEYPAKIGLKSMPTPVGPIWVPKQ